MIDFTIRLHFRSTYATQGREEKLENIKDFVQVEYLFTPSPVIVLLPESQLAR